MFRNPIALALFSCPSKRLSAGLLLRKQQRSRCSSFQLAPSLQSLTERSEPSQAVLETQRWLNQVVIGLNLCPFADVPNRDNEIRFVVEESSDENCILESLDRELKHSAKSGETTLVICPNLYPHSFEGYLRVSDGLELDSPELAGIVQVANFHPLFLFAGEDEDDISHWTNRSPFPTFHILQEHEVEIAVRKLKGNHSKVWQTNIDLLKHLENTAGEQALTEFIQSGDNQALLMAEYNGWIRAAS